ncbi:MAG TPA: hypothetical protein PL060_02080, partial [bacterium]|nr:hypothetical protein [bacterium]
MKKALWLVGVLLLFWGIVFGYEIPGYGSKYFMPDEEVVTPHIKWLKPSAQQPLKVLFLGYRLNGGFREIVEISQRMDIKYDVFASDTPYDYLQPQYSTPSIITTELYDKILKEKLSGNYDVIVSGISWNVLPLWAKYELLKKIKEGTNFLFYQRTAQDTDEYLTRATTNQVPLNLQFVFPYRALPAFGKYRSFDEFVKASFACYSFGKGKIFIIKNYVAGTATHFLCPVRTSKSALETNYSDYDYYLAFIIRAILCAADRQPECVLTGPDYIKVDYGNQVNINLNVESQKEKSVSYNVVVRKKSGDEVLNDEKNLKLNAGKNNLSLNFNDLPAGSYYVDVWIKNAGKIVDFGSCFLEVSSQQNIEKIELNRSYKKTDSISGKIVLKQQPENGLIVKIQHRDNFGRLLQQNTLTADSSEIKFTLSPANYLTVVNNVNVQLIKDGKVIVEKNQKFLISDIEPVDDFRSILWYGPIDTAYPSFYLYNIYYNSGIDTIYPLFSDMIPLANLSFIGICDSVTWFFADRKS